MSELLNQKYPLWLQMVVAMVAGLAVGLALSPQAAALVSSDTALMIGDWLSLPGMLFLALIKMIVVPLVAASITLAITGSQNMTAFRKNGTKAGLYFVATTCISVLIGILLVELGIGDGSVTLSSLKSFLLHFESPPRERQSMPSC